MESALVKKRTTCRLCDSSDIELAFTLTPTPPANAFVPADRKNIRQDVYPLDVMFCHGCTHVQLAHVVDPKLLFENYVYVSGTSPSFVLHFEDYTASIARFVNLPPGALVVDIGSNDGTLLRAFQRHHAARVLGIDPARNIAEAATSTGIETLAEFFSTSLASSIVAQRGPAAVVTANNVFAHIDDLASVVDGIRILLAPDGVFVFEVSYLLDVIEKTLFDTIYHEHLSYHSALALAPFLKRHGLELIDVMRVPTHGGSIRAIAQLHHGPHRISTSVSNTIELEKSKGLADIATLRDMARRIERLGEQIRALLKQLRSEGKSIAGFGAPAKATTLMYQLGIDPTDLEYIVDDSPLKQGLFTPGLHIPVVAQECADQKKPDYFLILAWNFAEQIQAKNLAFRKSGGHFIIPVPTVEVI